MIKETQIGQGGGKGTELDKLRAHAGAIRHQRPDIGRDYAGCHKYGQQEAYFGGVETTVVKKYPQIGTMTPSMPKKKK